jgi:inosine-uridine nucleoside N-ribohydrolase
MKMIIKTLVTASLLALSLAAAQARTPVIVDLDIGDDIDDSFALALLLKTPEIELLGISTAWGDTALRVQMVQRLLRETGRSEIPVYQGLATRSEIGFTQARWAAGPHEGGAPAQPARPAGASVDFLLQQARQRPGEITLLALGPLTNVAAAIDRDPQAFRQFKQVVLMGGSVRVGYSKSDYQAPRRTANTTWWPTRRPRRSCSPRACRW